MATAAQVLARMPMPEFPPDEWLISEDGVPLESDWHLLEIGLLVRLAHVWFADRKDFFAGGNMFIYFNWEHARDRDFRGPDFFFVWGASPMPLRPYWAVWKEGGKYPNVIIELLSPSTAEEDLTVKKDVYEQTFRTPEYYCYDPETHVLQGWRLNPLTYEPIVPNEKGWMWSEQWKMWLGNWHGHYMNRDATWLRFYEPDGTLVPIEDETARFAVAKLQEDAAAAEQRAAAAELRAVTAEAELARLNAERQPKND